MKIAYAKIGRVTNLDIASASNVGGDIEVVNLFQRLIGDGHEVHLISRFIHGELPTGVVDHYQDGVFANLIQLNGADREEIVTKGRCASPRTVNGFQSILDGAVKQFRNYFDGWVIWLGEHNGPAWTRPVTTRGRGEFVRALGSRMNLVWPVIYLVNELKVDPIWLCPDPRNILNCVSLDHERLHRRPILAQYDDDLRNGKYEYAAIELLSVDHLRESRANNDRVAFGAMINEGRLGACTRSELVKPWVIDHGGEIVGRWRDETCAALGIDPPRSVPHSEVQRTLARWRSTITLPASGGGWATAKPWEAFAARTACFRAPGYDDQDHVYGHLHADVRAFLSPTSPDELKKRVRAVARDDKLYENIVLAQLTALTIARKTYDRGYRRIKEMISEGRPSHGDSAEKGLREARARSRRASADQRHVSRGPRRAREPHVRHRQRNGQLHDGHQATSAQTRRGQGMNAIGIDIFAGGFTLGVKDHFNVIAHFEENDYGVATMRHNQPEIPVFVGAERWPVHYIRDHHTVDFIYGNPPCAAWSPLGRVIQCGSSEGMNQWANDPRVSCTRVVFNALEFFRPTVWAWESVPQAFTRGRTFVDELTEKARDLGYAVDYVLHNAMYLGAHQHRKRFFMVCTKVDIDWQCDFTQPMTVGETLQKIKRPKKQDQPPGFENYAKGKFIKTVKQGEHVRTAGERWNAKYPARKIPKIGFSYGRPALDDVAPAQISARLVHPTEDRMFTIQEMMAFSGFPMSYTFLGRPIAQASLLGRGVMPPVGRWLAENVKRGIKRGVSALDRVRLVNYYKPMGEVSVL